MQAAADVPMQVRSESSFSERRINPSWSIAQFKTRLEPITGIPSTAQRLALKLGGSQPNVPIEAANEEATQLSAFALQAYAEINVSSQRAVMVKVESRNACIVTPNPSIAVYTWAIDFRSRLPPARLLILMATVKSAM